MKRNELIQLKGLDLKELMLKSHSLKGEIANFVMDKNMKKLKDLKMISKKRKDLAQVLTISRQKKLLAQLESKVSAGQSSRKTKSKEGSRTELSKKA